jgi:MOSC domain-containing protein YiiM
MSSGPAHPQAIGHVVSVNVGRPRQVSWHNRTVTTSIWKRPVEGRVRAAGVNLAGDDQSDRRVHGGPTKAVYAYAIEDYHWWAGELSATLDPGTFGENLSLAGVDLGEVVVGERWRIGTTTFRVTEPRIPCFKLGIRMGDAAFVDRFAGARRPGTYCAIEEPGDIGAGDTVHLLSRPSHGVTTSAIARAYHGQDEVPALLAELDDLSESWRDWAGRHLDGRRVGEDGPGRT